MPEPSKLLQEINNRTSPLVFDDRPIEEEALSAVLEAARLAPSSYNHQPWRYLVALSEEARAKMGRALVAGNFWAKQAPATIAVVSKPALDDTIDGKEYYLYDCGLSVMSLVVEAEHQGLAAHQMIGFDERVVKREFSISEDWRVVVVIALGYRGDLKARKGSFIARFGLESFQKIRDRLVSPRSRKNLEEIACFNVFGFEG